MSDLVLRAGPENGVATLTLNRTEKKNALSIALRDEVSDALDALAGDDAVKTVVITGAGDVFSSGFDLREFQQPELSDQLWASSDRFHATVLQFPLPLVAAVNGPAIAGGFDLAVMCDLRVAADTARFAHPEIEFGDVVYGPLHDLVGGAVARELCFTGRVVEAHEAKALRLVSSVVPAGELTEEVARFTDLIVRAPRDVLLRTKAKPSGAPPSCGTRPSTCKWTRGIRAAGEDEAMGDLAIDTAIEGSDGRYHARLSRDWEIWGPNGGYLAVIALRAAGAHTPLRRPATFSCHFLGVADFDMVDLEVRPVRESRRAASIAVSMTQAGKPILEALTWIVGDVDGLVHDAASMPAVAPPDDLPSVEELIAADERGPYHAFWSNFEERPLAWLPRSEWERREPGDPSFRSWFRYVPRETFDDPFVDAGRALLLADTVGWPAAVRAYRADLPYYAPSIDVTVRFHAAAPGTPWLLVEGRSPVARDGLVASSVSVWAADGRLLATGGQQMLCRPMSLQAP